MKKAVAVVSALFMSLSLSASLVYAENPVDVSDKAPENNYAKVWQNRLDDNGMFGELVQQYNAVNYFSSVDSEYIERYTSGRDSEPLTLGFNIRTSNYAFFSVKSDNNIDDAKKVLDDHFSGAHGSGSGEYGCSYRIVDNCFYVLDYKNTYDFQKMHSDWESIYSEMNELEIIDAYYYPGEIYEEHELYIPYLTKYPRTQVHGDERSEPVTEEELQNYLVENSLPFSVVYEEEEHSQYYYLIPEEEMDFSAHFDVVLSLWNDLHIMPYVYDDNFKSNFPTIAARKGDVNVDGEFNSSDVVLTMKYFLSNESVPDESACDMNLDGKINITDFSLMKKELLG